mgnify:CR=1 FL=1
MTYSVKRRKGNKVNTTFRKKSNKTPGHYSTIEGGDSISQFLQNVYSKGKKGVKTTATGAYEAGAALAAGKSGWMNARQNINNARNEVSLERDYN